MGLNYIWDLIIKSERAGIAKRDISFAVAEVYSPYMELSLESLNARTAERRVELNPYYRFDHIFDGMFDINNDEDVELREQLFDILIHFLADIDLTQGLNKREFYIRFALRDLENGAYGDKVMRSIGLFGREERDMIALNLLRLYETGEAVYLLKDTMRKVFKRSTIYANCEEKDELLVYVGQEETEEARAKVGLIMDIFLPVRFHVEFYWNRHFGILGLEDTMRQDGIAMY
ncbi:iron-dependent peroxidase [Paenibacillus plantiphilus]|uniref:iron-dependent peroxidase n=1 Tax=Paenibacillus plantiphilus TaxID=2905650 RepID=UPI001F447006|nr:iron-dependent peroxidase [Paenibacillus plantiphilus]